MPKKKLYKYYICKDCEIDFIMCHFTRKGTPFCPQCAENVYVEKIKGIWMERPFNYKRPWTQEEDETILVSVEQGYTHKEIADALNGRTKNAVNRRLQRLRKGLVNKG